ncbi:TIGR03013 family XrtA/PEP-CTERM system glycosyltransferase [Aestuariispira insulae]|nr:TIGR03013 family XrtA/PEP-CTERM system glycosyltransferase [Aestuariispira insulae]
MIKLFNHHISLHAILLAATEVALLIVGGFLLMELMPIHVGASLVNDGGEVLVASLPLAVFLVVCSVGLYSRRVIFHNGFQASQWVTVFALMSGVLGIGLFVFWWSFMPEERFPFSFWAATVAMYSGIGLGLRFAFSQVFRDSEIFRKRVVVLGTGPQAQKIFRGSLEDKKANVNVVGFVGLDGQDSGPVRPLLPDLLHNSRYALADYAQENNIDEIVVTLADRRRPEGGLGGGLPVWEMMDCKLRGIQITEFDCFWEREFGKVELSTIRPSWIIFSDGFQVSAVKRVMKRAFDLLFSSLFLLATLPVLLLTALAIKLDSAGPVFYSQKRVGLNGNLFPVLKFRSMRTDAEKNGAQWASKSDSRVTRVGKFIRKTRIDEIPQILNVFRGEMSFVGPRPERPDFMEELEREVPYYSERHRVKPGITGWAQINYPYGATIEDARQKHSYDLYYLKNISIFLDLVILVQTVRVVLFGEGAR